MPSILESWENYPYDGPLRHWTSALIAHNGTRLFRPPRLPCIGPVSMTYALVVEGEGPVGRVCEVVAPDPVTRRALAVDGGERPCVVSQDPDGAQAGAVQHQVVQ